MGGPVTDGAAWGRLKWLETRVVGMAGKGCYIWRHHRPLYRVWAIKVQGAAANFDWEGVVLRTVFGCKAGGLQFAAS
jgi:hypothetical protein